MAKTLDSTYVPKPGESSTSTAAALSRILQAHEQSMTGPSHGAASKKMVSQCVLKNMHPKK